MGTRQSLCPVCLRVLPAAWERQGDAVYQVKQCPEHGRFRALIWQGPPDMDDWRRPKIPAQLALTQHEVERGCPYDCGLCPEHRQRTCTAILEVTQACDLACPVCYADSPRQLGPLPSQDQIQAWYSSVARHAAGCNIQLSGGEPTLRDDLPRLVALGREAGFGFIQVNTNGLRLARDPAFVEALARAGLASVFLSFDGVNGEVYQALRGRPLLQAKLAAIQACGAQGIGVVLVPTLAPGVNLDQVGPILDLAQKLSPVVRAVHFQPVSRFGRFPQEWAQEERLTLPQLMRLIDEQTKGRFPAAAFRPPGCENSLCSFQGNFLLMPGGAVRALSRPHDPACCGPAEAAEQGARRTIARVARQWAPAGEPAKSPQAACGCAPPGAPIRLDEILQSAGSPEGWQEPELDPSAPPVRPAPISLDDFLDLARGGTLSVSAMAFQDAGNLDLDRVRDCCIHVVSPAGELIPFCLYNLTSFSGRRLYRP